MRPGGSDCRLEAACPELKALGSAGTKTEPKQAKASPSKQMQANARKTKEKRGKSRIQDNPT